MQEPVVRFGEFCLDSCTGELRTAAGPRRLQQQPLRVLRALLERRGELVAREELKRLVWGAALSGDLDQRLNFCIKQVRAALGDRADAPRFVETLPRRGYRFIAPIETVALPPPAGEAHRPWRSHARRLAAALAVASLLGPAPPGRDRAHDAPSRTLLAVLPFEGQPGASSDALSDGLTEETINGLGRLSPERLGVIARSSAMAYKGGAKPLGQVGRELGVSHVVEGSVCRAGRRLQIDAKLLRVDDQSQLWAERYELEDEDVLQLQSLIAARIASSVREHLMPAATAAPADTVGA
jgi:TolB-like protein/DNA-binding winged helix-turn-helix (wHTH) protein